MYLLGKSWRYMNEGNVHVVLELVDTEFVLRFIKEEGKPIVFNDIQQSLNFVSLVMLPILSNYVVSNDEIIIIQKNELSQLCKDILKFRPEKRRFKYLLSKFAIKTLNLTILSPKCKVNYCVEIKPKEGFMSSSFVGLSKCYFCLKQYVKLQNNHINETSGYCPLDLFSGDKSRMKHALLSLIDNPQNNFKIFKDGYLIYDEKSKRTDLYCIIQNMSCFKTLDMFIEFIIETLLNENGTEHIQEKNIYSRVVPFKKNKCNENTKLNNNTFLYKLLELQRLSDSVTINTNDIKLKNNEYVSLLLEDIQLNDLNLSFKKDQEILYKITDPLHLAMISAVAKDCSVMISFSPNYIEELPSVQIEDDKISYRLSVTDLEPKSVQTLIKRKDAERKMIEVYKMYAESADMDQDGSNHTQKQERSN